MTQPALVRMSEITGSEALWLLGGTDHGQLVFVQRSVIVIRPASHVLERGDLIVRAPAPAAVLTDETGTGVMATYHAQGPAPADGSGWQVTTTGLAEVVTDPYQLAHYRRTLPGCTLGPHDTIARIRPQLTHGYRIGPGQAADGPDSRHKVKDPAR